MSQILLQPANAMITLENVNKWYGQFHVLKNINLTVQPGERIVLCGPSGSGKSTTIRCINHLEEHQQGRMASNLMKISAILSASGRKWEWSFSISISSLI